MNRKSLLILLVVGLASFVSACGSSGKPKTVISVTLAPAPPATLEVSNSVQVAADTPGDSTNAGVNWTISCTSADCGSITPAQTAPGAPAVYLAPKTVPAGGGGSVTITATSVTDSSAAASGTTTINPLGSNAGLVAAGQYAFVVTGIDSVPGFYAIAGSITSDGNGNITAGEEDFSDVNFATTDTVTGTYSIGPDGRGTITLNPLSGGVPDTNLGMGGIQTFSITATSNFVNNGTHLLITEVDGSATSTGTIDLQNSNDFAGGVAPNTYVFAITGWDLSDDAPTSFGGVLTTADGATIASGIVDENDAGTATTSDPTGGTITTLDANGRGVIAVGTNSYPIYMVGPEAFKVMENDNNFVAGGSIFGAAAATGASSTYVLGALSGNYAFFESGQGTLGPVAYNGQLTADGNGNLTGGFSDIDEGGTVTNGAVAGTYAIPDPTMPRAILTITGGNTGDISTVVVYLADPTLNFLDPNNTNAASGALLVDGDPDVYGAGLVVAQAPPTENPILGNYALGLQVDTEDSDEVDLVGQGFVDTSGNFTGTVDLGAVGGNALAVPATITFTGDANNPGRATGTGSINGSEALSFVVYQVSGAQGFVIENDTFEVAAGTAISQ